MKKSIRKQRKTKQRQEKLKLQKAKQASRPRIFRQYPGLEQALAPHHPLYSCLINEDWREEKMASIAICRRSPTGLVTAIFLVDMEGFGLKESDGFYPLDEQSLEEIRQNAPMTLIPCDPAQAAALVHGGVAWAKRHHFKLPEDHHLWLRLLPPPLEIDLTPFGRNGRPLLVLDEEEDAGRQIFEEETFDRKILSDPLTIGSGPPSRTLLERIGDIKGIIIDFARRACFSEEREAARKIFRGLPEKLVRKREDVCFLDWFILEYESAVDFGLIETFLDEYDEILSNDVVDMIEHWPDVIEGLFEVKAVEGDGYVLFNLINERRYKVYPTRFDIALKFTPDTFLAARIVPVGGAFHVFSGVVVPIISDGSIDKKMEIYNSALRYQMHYPREAFRDNPEKLALSLKRAREDHEEFLAFFGSDEVTGTGRAIAEQHRNFFRHRYCERRDLQTGKTKAEEYREQYGKPYELPSLDLPETLLNCPDAAMLHDPIEGVLFLEEYGSFMDIFRNPSRNLDRKESEDLFFGYLESESITDLPFRRAAAAWPEGFRRAVDHYTAWEDFEPCEIDNFLMLYKPQMAGKYPYVVVMSDELLRAQGLRPEG